MQEEYVHLITQFSYGPCTGFPGVTVGVGVFVRVGVGVGVEVGVAGGYPYTWSSVYEAQ